MGHSKRSPSVVSSSSFRTNGHSREETLDKYTETISSKDAAKIVDYGVRYIIPFLPNGSAKMPIYYCVRYGIQFLRDSQEHGVEQATQNLAKTVIKEHVVHYAVDYMWDSIESNVVQSGANKALVSFSEQAFKETMNDIMINGADAL